MQELSIDEAWAIEIDARMRAYDAGEVETIEADAAFREAFDDLRLHREAGNQLEE